MDKRTVLTITLCILVFFLWTAVVNPILFPRTAPPPQPSTQEQTATQQPPPRPPVEQSARQPATDWPAPPPAPVDETQRPEAKVTTLANENLTVELTDQGASILNAYLNNYPENASTAQPLRLLAPIDASRRALGIQLSTGRDLAAQPFEIASSSSDSVTYRAELSEGLVVTKTISLPAGAYHVGLDVTITNTSGQPVDVGYWLTSAAGVMPELPPWQKDARKPLKEIRNQQVEGAIGSRLEGGQFKVIKKNPRALQKQPEDYRDTPVLWAGVKNQYFLAVLKTADEASPILGGRLTALGQFNMMAGLQVRQEKLQPEQAGTHSFIFFIGPTKNSVLSQPLYSDFAPMHVIPWPAPLTKVFLGILHAFYSVVGNYGIAIILLTILVRVALHPLSRKSQKSMHHMQKLGPKMKELRDKYKDDKKKQQEETMKLYREHGVNPMGGCLPILLQLPILIALYGALRSAIELRQAPFFLWMKDLSQPDALAILPHWVPYVAGSPLNILPLLMIIAMVVQQKLSPKGGDPQSEQTQKMMLWLMPPMFGLLFYGMPSGLVLYFMTSTALGALESHLIRKHLEKLELAPVKRSEKETKETWLERASRAKLARGRKIK